MAQSVYRPGYDIEPRFLAVRFRKGQEIVLFSKASRPVLRPAHLTIQWAARLKRAVREYDHTPPCSKEARNERSYTFGGHSLSMRVQKLRFCNGDELCPQWSTE